MTNSLRRCRKCGLEAKSEEDLKNFVLHKPSPYGRQNYCKKCRNKYVKEWENINRENINAGTRRYKQKIRNDVLVLYGNKCVCCGESFYEFLTLDHINGGGREESRRLGGTYAVYKRARDLFYSDKEEALKTYRILCWNCNCAIGNHGYCPHKQHKK